MPAIKIALSRVPESDRAAVILSGSNGEAQHDSFFPFWKSHEEWKAVFLSLELYARDKTTWPSNSDILSRAEELSLFVDTRPANKRLRVVGSLLFDAVFQSEKTRQLLASLLNQKDSGAPIVQLHIADRGSLLQALPWELLHDGERFLFDSRRASVVRYIDFPGALGKIELRQALRTLLIDPRPDLEDDNYSRLPLLDRPYLERLSNQFPGQFVFDDLAPSPSGKGTLDELHYYLMTSPKDFVHIVHIDTHGNYGRLCSCKTLNAPNARICKKCNLTHPKEQKAKGYLGFQAASGEVAWVSGDELGAQLYGKGIEIVVLSACKSGLVAGSGTFNSIAGALIKHGIPAVIAMQFSIDDKASEIFVENFYTALMTGAPLTGAVAEARLGLAAASEDSWYRPVLYLRNDPKNYRGEIFVPKFPIKSQRPLISDLRFTSRPKMETGTMAPDSTYYVERELDKACIDYLWQDYSVTIALKAPRQMGKSSLIRRVTFLLEKELDRRIAYIDFQKFPEQLFQDEEAFLIEFCLMIGDVLNIPEEIDSYWASRWRTNLIKCTNYFCYHIAPKVQGSFVLAMDEMERLLDSPFRNNFFGMLRTWHNDRALDEELAKVSLLLCSSTEPHLFIDNPNQSPFNVAVPIPKLGDFSYQELEVLNEKYLSPIGGRRLERLHTLLGGHPYLSRLAFYLVATEQYDFESLEKVSASSTGPFADHLNRYWQHISEMPEILNSINQICRDQSHPEDKIYYRLKGAGLIKKVDSKLYFLVNWFPKGKPEIIQSLDFGIEP